MKYHCEFCNKKEETRHDLFIHLKDQCEKVPRQMKRRLERQFQKMGERISRCIICKKSTVGNGNPYCVNHQYVLKEATERIMLQTNSKIR